jgi:hypothetical protein
MKLLDGAHCLAQVLKGQVQTRVSKGEPTPSSDPSRPTLWQEEFEFEANPDLRDHSVQVALGFHRMEIAILSRLDRGLKQRVVLFDMYPQTAEREQEEIRVASAGAVREVPLALMLCVKRVTNEVNSYRFVVRYTTEYVS